MWTGSVGPCPLRRPILTRHRVLQQCPTGQALHLGAVVEAALAAPCNNRFFHVPQTPYCCRCWHAEACCVNRCASACHAYKHLWCAYSRFELSALAVAHVSNAACRSTALVLWVATCHSQAVTQDNHVRAAHIAHMQKACQAGCMLASCATSIQPGMSVCISSC
jgi:hypothetical protein